MTEKFNRKKKIHEMEGTVSKEAEKIFTTAPKIESG